MKRVLMIALSGIFIALCCYSVYKVLNVDEKQLAVKGQPHDINGKNISAMQVKDLDGRHDDIKNHLTGDINIINFWASWCEPCNKEMPEYVKYDDEKPPHVAVLGMNIQDKESDREAFIKRYHANYPMLVADNKVVKQYKIYNIPTTIFVDKEGKVLTTYVGELDSKKLASLVKTLN